MPAAVRFGDYCAGHCFEARPNDQASPNFFINGLGVHRVTDHWPTHSCPPASHDSNQAEGSPNFFVNGLAVARVGASGKPGAVHHPSRRRSISR